MNKSVNYHIQCALLATILVFQIAYANSPNLVTEHDWTLSSGDYTFGFEQFAPIISEPHPLFPKGYVFMPRTTWIYFGPWSKRVEGMSAPTIIFGAIAILLLVLAFFVRILCRKATENR